MDSWDVIILGAGPAGSVTAALLGRQGRRVLLVDRAQWPREKACGGCLNQRAVKMLQQLGMGTALGKARPIGHSTWHIGRFSLEMPTPGGLAVPRRQLDAALVEEAIRRGVTFRPGTSALLLSADANARRAVRLQTGRRAETVEADYVLACDGINGTSLKNEAWARWRIAANSFIGASVTLTRELDGVSPGVIHMHVGPGGYVGSVRLADGRVHLGAAIDPKICRRSGGPARVIERILHSCGHPAVNLSAMPQASRLLATGKLTRRRTRQGGRRVLAVGDACGYVEPFTGEGIAWTIASAKEAAELLPADGCWRDDLTQQWSQRRRRMIESHQQWCGRLRPMMHRPSLAAAALVLGHLAPPVGALLSRHICRGGD